LLLKNKLTLYQDLANYLTLSYRNFLLKTSDGIHLSSGIRLIKLNFDKLNGVVPAIVQDYATGDVLMVGFMNREAWEHTLLTGTATYYSRSRQELWVKGRTSGNIQRIREIRIDCDDDAVLLKVDQAGGAACHTGHRTCFFKRVENESIRIVGTPVFDPKEVYKK
jgi:phosphoribosyl-AMP cyclohydrolase